ncbi:B3 domain-containing protein Os01g0234100-like isoform X1 [Primulina tabacum]|uniref:B3 domain-containing protein Os01g0234100-like isoform X1 n=1 Tax=Primulina tabacum TaxID=48773 RepID=UPI003F59C703
MSFSSFSPSNGLYVIFALLSAVQVSPFQGIDFVNVIGAFSCSLINQLCLRNLLCCLCGYLRHLLEQADARNIVLPTVCYEVEPIASFDPDNRIGTSTPAMVRALKVQKTLSPQSPSFLKLMLGSHVSGGFWLGLPKRFCDFHLPKQDDTMVLVDEDGQEYNTKYLVNKNGLSGGWRGFSIAHKLLDGDVLIFQLVEPHKLKVYIVRASSLTEVDGASGHLNSETEINPVKTVQRPEDNSSGASKIAKQKYLEPISVDDKTHILSSHNAVVADQSGKIHDDIGSEDLEHIRFSQTNIKFNDMKCFEDFNIHVNGVFLNSEVPAQLRMKYYDLCCSQSKFLHENLVEGLNSKLVTGMISEIVSTADAIESARLTTPLSHLETWERKLKAFEDLGMAVGFLRSRIHQLVTLSQESRAVMESKKKERDEVEGEMKALEAKFLNVKAVVKRLNAEIHDLEVEHRELGVVFRDIARAAW